MNFLNDNFNEDLHNIMYWKITFNNILTNYLIEYVKIYRVILNQRNLIKCI